MKKFEFKTKKELTAIAVLLLLTMIIFPTALMKSANAYTYTTYCYVVAYPEPIGINQQMNVVMWLSIYPPQLIINGASTIGGDMWKGFSLTITKPDGTVETKGPYTSDYMGAAFITYTPTQLGTYTFQLSFPGQTMPANQGGNTYKASTSGITRLTVQQDAITTISDGVIPTGYWQRPINDENRAWSPIAGNWLMAGYDYNARSFDGGSAFNPYTQAPNAPHIVWAQPLYTGGLIGAPYGSDLYYTGSSYEMKMTPPIIMNGVLYYNTGGNPSRSAVPPGITAIDIRTGKTLWTKNVDALDMIPINNAPTLGSQYGQRYPALAFGTTQMYNSVNQFGAFPYLWASGGTSPNATLDMYDAYSGEHWLRIVNCTTGTFVIATATPGESGGDLLCYVYNPTAGWLALWNATRCILRSTPTALGSLGTVPNVDLLTVGAWYWRPPYNASIDFNYGYQWNVTIPKMPTAASFLAGSQPFEGVLIASRTINPTADSTTGWPIFEHTAYNANTGAFMWSINRTNLGLQSRGGHITPFGNGIYTMYCAETLQWYGYSIKTGAQVWGPTAADQNCWGYYNTADVAGYGKLFGCGIDGIVHCYDITNGNLLWNWTTGSSGYETPYQNYPIYGGSVVADGKLYINQGTHGNGAGLWKGNTMSCLDCNTGQLLWRIEGWFDGSTLAIADGYIIAHNYYDNQIYCFGKGMSEVTVSASPKVVAKDSNVLIEGTVSDKSPGQTCLGIPAAGTPAISDDSMSAWMRYLYMQGQQPTNATGVPVFLQAMKSDGTVIDIWHATTDIMGHYEYTWTPPTADTYKILATFEGSNSYYTSSEQTGLSVGPAVSALTANDVASQVVSQMTPGPTAPSASDVASEVVAQLPGEDNTLLYAVIAIGVIIALLVAVNIVISLRKQGKTT